MAQSNITYAVQFRSNLQAVAWQTLSNVASAGTERTVEIFDPATVPGGGKFYRVLTPAK